MKKTLLLAALLLIILSGCNKLDTSNLKVKEPEDEATDHQIKNRPITYVADTLEDGLNALPFDVVLPENLPFEAAPFEAPMIMDLNHDGRMLMAQFKAYDKGNKEIMLLIQTDFPVVESSVPESEKIELSNEMKGFYSKNSIAFQLKDVAYSLIYMNETITPAEHKEELIQLANQIIDKKQGA